jgi:hypothetical protein
MTVVVMMVVVAAMRYEVMPHSGPLPRWRCKVTMVMVTVVSAVVAAMTVVGRYVGY